MTSTDQPKDDLLSAPARNRRPRIALRRRSSDHPMAMFAIVTGIALLTMAFVPSAGPSLVNFGAPAKISDDIRTAVKVAELPVRAADIACHGQTWGDEDDDCLATIAKDSGKGDRVIKVRRLASAAPLVDAPNVF